MDKKLLEQLVDYSYTGNELNRDKVGRVIKLFKGEKAYLKEYLKALRKKEKSLSVYIDIAMDNFVLYKNELKKIFANKKIVWNIDPSLFLGIRITEGDDVLEISLKKSLEDIVSEIEKSYD